MLSPVALASDATLAPSGMGSTLQMPTTVVAPSPSRSMEESGIDILGVEAKKALSEKKQEDTVMEKSLLVHMHDLNPLLWLTTITELPLLFSPHKQWLVVWSYMHLYFFG